MHLIQSLKIKFCFDLPMFSKYPATSINSYFYKMTLLVCWSPSHSQKNNIKIELFCANVGLSLKFLFESPFQFSIPENPVSISCLTFLKTSSGQILTAFPGGAQPKIMTVAPLLVQPNALKYCVKNLF